MSPHPFLLLLSTALYASTALTARDCYTPDGQINKQGTHKPCNASAPVSACCLDTANCLSNGMCKVGATENTGVRYGRGTCTDPTWKSPFCPSMCKLSKSSGIRTMTNRSRPLMVDVIDQDASTNSSAYDFAANPVPIWECGTQGFAKEAEYCCESAFEGQRCCSTSSALFRVPGATLGAFTGTPTTGVHSVTTTIRTGTESLESMAISTSASLAPTSTNLQAGSEIKKDSNGSKIGAGIGGGLGGLLFIAAGVILFLWQKRRKQKVAKSFQYEFEGQDNKQIVNGGYGPVEMPVSHDPPELHSREVPQELPAEEIVDEHPLRT
jgi:hypothetical protein